MYFVLSGSIGIGYSLVSGGLSKKQYRIGKKAKAATLICDHYVLNNIKSEFLYLVIKPIETLALTKKFLFKQVFPKYPEICLEMRDEAHVRYRILIHKPIVT